ncbi:SspB-related isopeptide-forming adhesin, partial [Ligilactobacillus equi]
DATGTIANTMSQTNEDHGYKTNTVKNDVEPNPTPVKVVVNSDGTNIDKTTVLPGQMVTYTGTWDLSELANHKFTKDELAKDWTFDDDYDEAKISPVTDSLKVTDAKNNDITKLFKPVWDEKAGKWVLTPNDTKAFLETYKGQKLTVSFNSVVKADATGTLANTMNQTNNSVGYKTNTVTNDIATDPKPTKVVMDEQGKDVNKATVKRNAKLVYQGTWDLSELANHTFTKEELAKNWTFSDDYDETKFTADEGSFKVTDAKGNDVTSLFDAKWDAKNGKVVVTPKNVETFLNTFKGQKLDVEFAGKVNKDAKGVLENTMVQT